MANMVWLNECCKICGGNMYLEVGDYGKLYRKCLMCSRAVEIKRGRKRLKKLAGVR